MKMALTSTVCTFSITAMAIAGIAIANAADTPASPMAAPVSAAPEKVAMCRGCHGIARYRTAFPQVYSVPKLGGQEAAYIVKALQDYKRGLRSHATMQSIAATLTDQQVAAIATYYADTHQ
jgi:cytochrome c553